jgi:hypothetical protein
MDGWKISISTRKDNETSYMLRKGTDAVTLQLELKDKSLNDKFVKTAINQLNNLESHPVGPSDIDYKTPTYTQKAARSCDYVTNGDMKQLTGKDMSPLVQSLWSTSTGVVSSNKDGNKKSNYVRNACIHTVNADDNHQLVGSNIHTLRIVTTSYENSKAASDGIMKVSIGEGNDSSAKIQSVGDEAYTYKSMSTFERGVNMMTFRVGRVVVELTYDLAKQDSSPSTSDLTQYGQTLSPLAQAVTDRLKAF